LCYSYGLKSNTRNTKPVKPSRNDFQRSFVFIAHDMNIRIDSRFVTLGRPQWSFGLPQRQMVADGCILDCRETRRILQASVTGAATPRGGYSVAFTQPCLPLAGWNRAENELKVICYNWTEIPLRWSSVAPHVCDCVGVDPLGMFHEWSAKNLVLTAITGWGEMIFAIDRVFQIVTSLGHEAASSYCPFAVASNMRIFGSKTVIDDISNNAIQILR
jgi:hypothetical protein